MKVAWMSHSSVLAGAQLALVEAVKGLAALGVVSDVYILENGPLTDRLRGVAQSVTLVPRSRPWVHERRTLGLTARCLLRNLQAARRMASLFNETRPDVVVTNTTTIPAGALAAWMAGIPHVWYLREFGREDYGLEFDLGGRISFSIIDHLSTAIIANSRAIREAYARKLPREKMEVVYAAVEVPAVAAVPREAKFTLINISNRVRGKGQEDAILALSILVRRGIDVRLVLVGHEDQRCGRDLRRLSQRLEVEELVNFLPFADPPFGHVVAANLLLVCSHHEAFGRVTVEAMKLGRPVIGASAGGTLELIRDGWNGLLYPPGDSARLADQIETLYRNPGLLEDMGRKARDWASATFTMQKFAADLLAVLEKAGRARGRYG